MTDILIVEDQRDISSLLCDFLRAENYIVTVAEDGEKALALYEKYGAKLVILDVMLPGMDGFAVCSGIRKLGDVPIIILSARTEKDDKLNGLILGADDYMEKPFDIDILLAKIRGIFKRRYSMEDVVAGNLRIDQERRMVYKDGILLNMTAKEFDLLLLLVENEGKVMRKESIFQQVWGSDSVSEPQTLTVHVKWLREKIEEDPANPKKIQTVWGVGYRFG
ncbi:MAG: response regulator transcription factor [Lachnospiraceae bacterium]|nr:response regulator transcription factor [Lachnospiraceae bacterium]